MTKISNWKFHVVQYMKQLSFEHVHNYERYTKDKNRSLPFKTKYRESMLAEGKCI